MLPVKLNGHVYYEYSDIAHSNPKLKCPSRSSLFVKKYDVGAKNTIHARKIGKKWVVSNGKSKKMDKLFIRRKWFDEYFEDDTSDSETDDDQNANCIPKTNKIPEIPQVVDIEKNNSIGGNMDILLVGKRTYDGIYFYAKDISREFGLKNVSNTLRNPNGSFVENTHYIYFMPGDSPLSCIQKMRKVKQLFITYVGLLKLLYTSRNKQAEKFVRWASQIVFTAHIGVKDDKIKLAADLVGVSGAAVREFLNTSSKTIPCIYLFQIGTVSKLRKSMKISAKYDDSDIVGKWGYTSDLARRTGEHSSNKSYGGIAGSSISLIYHSPIDPKYVSKAEKNIKDYFIGNGYKLDYSNHDELVIIKKKQLSVVKTQYHLLGSLYAGHVAELTSKIKDMENKAEIEKQKYLTELLRESNRADIMEKDNEILRLKLELAKSKGAQ